ncbi:MAG: Glucose-6-phosphate 1-dehydrogenase [candidate division BRC1 bacterium ADurb.BinA364]|nr:MAG: Glucose-6-phosphate 1-dehydrogenase [candidate division BRC1 bacterium ADurb.BinA364]
MSTADAISFNPADREPWRSPPMAVTIFGASGDLTTRKLGPALFNLWREGCLGEPFALIGCARTDKSDDAFRAEIREGAERYSRVRPDAAAQWDAFARNIHYVSGSLSDDSCLARLRQRLDSLERAAGQPMGRLFYLAVAPSLFGPAAESLARAGLARRDASSSAARLVVEKPFGVDLASARELTHELTRLLDESQIYRIDHYLGKETVQDILSFRFGNSIFEPLFNNRYVEHVQITVAETVGMEGRRGAYYDTSGALRDMVQNHMLQLLCLAAMEPPAAFESETIHNEKLKVLRALRPMTERDAPDIVRGQYGAGEIDGRPVRAYRESEGVPPDSRTETYVAMRATLENWRWSGVPFLLRTGKCLPKRVTEIAVQFRRPPLRLFEAVGPEGDRCDIAQAQPNQLIFRIQPDEGIFLKFASKTPGMAFQLQTVEMGFDYKGERGGELPEAYERLLLDAMRGDSTLFMRGDEVEYAWKFVDSVREVWAASPAPEFPNYAPGSWGPPEANRLFRGTHGAWRRI